MLQVIRLVLLTTLVGLYCAAAQGAQIAFDSAGDSAYNSGWTQGSNGGFGWGSGWSFKAIAIIGDSTTNGRGDPEGDGDINSPRTVGGRAWGLLTGYATRAFSGPLSPGQTFSIDFDDYGGASPNFNPSVFLLAPGGAAVVGIRADIVPRYLIQTDSREIDTGVSETDQGIHITFTPVSSGVEVSLTPYIAGATTTTLIAPYTGQLAGLEFDSYPAPTQAGYTPFINNMAITPEPSSLGLLGLTVPVLAARRRRR